MHSYLIIDMCQLEHGDAEINLVFRGLKTNSF